MNSDDNDDFDINDIDKVFDKITEELFGNRNLKKSFNLDDIEVNKTTIQETVSNNDIKNDKPLTNDINEINVTNSCQIDEISIDNILENEPKTELLNDCRRVRPKKTKRPPSAAFLKEVILSSTEQQCIEIDSENNDNDTNEDKIITETIVTPEHIKSIPATTHIREQISVEDVLIKTDNNTNAENSDEVDGANKSHETDNDNKEHQEIVRPKQHMVNLFNADLMGEMKKAIFAKGERKASMQTTSTIETKIIKTNDVNEKPPWMKEILRKRSFKIEQPTENSESNGANERKCINKNVEVKETDKKDEKWVSIEHVSNSTTVNNSFQEIKFNMYKCQEPIRDDSFEKPPPLMEKKIINRNNEGNIRSTFEINIEGGKVIDRKGVLQEPVQTSTVVNKNLDEVEYIKNKPLEEPLWLKDIIKKKTIKSEKNENMDNNGVASKSISEDIKAIDVKNDECSLKERNTDITETNQKQEEKETISLRKREETKKHETQQQQIKTITTRMKNASSEPDTLTVNKTLGTIKNTQEETKTQFKSSNIIYESKITSNIRKSNNDTLKNEKQTLENYPINKMEEEASFIRKKLMVPSENTEKPESTDNAIKRRSLINQANHSIRKSIELINDGLLNEKLKANTNNGHLTNNVYNLNSYENKAKMNLNLNKQVNENIVKKTLSPTETKPFVPIVSYKGLGERTLIFSSKKDGEDAKILATTENIKFETLDNDKNKISAVIETTKYELPKTESKSEVKDESKSTDQTNDNFAKITSNVSSTLTEFKINEENTQTTNTKVTSTTRQSSFTTNLVSEERPAWMKNLIKNKPSNSEVTTTKDMDVRNLTWMEELKNRKMKFLNEN